MRRRLALALMATLLALPMPAWCHFQKANPNPLTDDPSSLFYHDFFDLPVSATAADSAAALHLPRSKGRHYVYFTGRIVSMEPLSKACFPLCYDPDSGHPYSSYWTAVHVWIEIDSVLGGDCPALEVEAIAKFARTPFDPGPFGWKSQLVQPGARIAGLLIYSKDPRVRDLPTLHGSSIFVFSVPYDGERLDLYESRVVDLFQRVGSRRL